MISISTTLILIASALAAPSTTRSTPPIPSGCSPALTYSIADFTFFNSTHNLDCTVSHDPSEVDCTGPNGAKCRDASDPACTLCTPVCYTGRSDQPWGYGPPDRVSFNIPDWYGPGNPYQCYQANPQSIRRYPVGEGHVGCGGAGSYAFFYGSSNRDAGSQGSITFSKSESCGGKSRSFGYEAKFDLSCARDVGGNATCAGPQGLVAALVSVNPSD